jgi:outer membrane protein OmpA-like peptidoglycan-associated protein
MRRSKIKLVGLAMIIGLIIPGLIATNVLAQRVIVKEVAVERVRVVEEVVKLADNFIVLFDASGSMQDEYGYTGQKKIELAKQIYEARTARLPDLDWNAGLYLYTPWKSFYDMQPFNKEAYIDALDQLAAYKPSLNYRNQPTPLGNAIKNLDPILAKLSGETVVSREIASKHDVSFYIISSAQTPKSEKLVHDIASVNTSSRAFSFDAVLSRPEYTTSALYMVRDRAIVETELISKVVGIELNNILFDYNSADIRRMYHDELDALAKFLENNPEAYVVLEGFADSTGDPKYNLALSRRRALSVKNYLLQMEIFSAAEANISAVAEKRLVTLWYGKDLPVASNDTAEGRQLNRRVRLTVGSIN